MDLNKNITEWFNTGANYTLGFMIYKQLPKPKRSVLKRLEKGQNSYNKTLLIKELRQFKNKPAADITVFKKKAPASVKTPAPDVTKDAQERLYKKRSEERQFKAIKYAMLPGELKLRYREAKDIFYQLCDLKFILNDLPAEEVKQALAIQLQIEELDEQRAIIWRELLHWQDHGTLLTTKAESFDNLEAKELYRLKANLKSKITKLEQRIEVKYNELITTTDKKANRLLEQRINKSEKLLHKHRVNLIKINELL